METDCKTGRVWEQVCHCMLLLISLDLRQNVTDETLQKEYKFISLIVKSF